MKITRIRSYILESIASEPAFRWRNGLPGAGDGTKPGQKINSAVIRLDTDEGITGVVNAGRGYAVSDIVRRRLSTLVGMDPLLSDRLWHEVWELDRIEEFSIGELGLIDLACWDIKSRKANMPLYQMLGGSQKQIPAYASTVTWNTMAEYEKYIKICQEEGFQAFKLHAWGDANEDAKLARNLRKWVGDDADLMFDGSAGWDYVTSLKFGRVLEECNFLWYEEPMREFDLPSYVELCRSLDIPVLAAETSDGVHWNAATWIQLRALDMMRTSAGYKGGITGAMRVAHLAESFGMRAQVHGGGYANLHICAAIPNNDYYEQLVINEQQIKGLKDEGPFQIIDGMITVPDEPGLGAHPDWDRLEKEAVLIIE